MSREHQSRAAWSDLGRVEAKLAGCANLGSGHGIGADYRNWAEWQRFCEMVPLRAGWRVAELGTGNGRWLEALASEVRECVGIDYSQPMLDLAAQRLDEAGLSNCRLLLGSVTEDLLSGQFDLIYFSGCLQYLDDADVVRALIIAVRHLAPDGIVVDRTTISLGARIEGTREQRHSLYRTREEHLGIFARAGLELVEQRKSHDWMWLPRLLRLPPVDRLLSHFLRVRAPRSYRWIARLSAWHARVLPSRDEREYSHDFFLFRRRGS